MQRRTATTVSRRHVLPRYRLLGECGQPLHIVLRRHNREPCFFAEEDYHGFLHWLGEALKPCGAALHAYALMTNHVHLLLTPAQAEDVARIVISPGRRYVQQENRTYRRTGTLWDSRYKSSLIETDRTLLICQRYIELNPARAAMLDDPAHYRWSNYRANALGKADANLTPHALYLVWVERRSSGRLPIVRSSAANLTTKRSLTVADIWLALNQNQALGGARFHRKIEKAVGERREARLRGRPRKTARPGSMDAGQRALGL